MSRNLWEFVSCMNERRYRPGVATLGGRMYVLGGEEGWDRYHDTIECYDPVSINQIHESTQPIRIRPIIAEVILF